MNVNRQIEPINAHRPRVISEKAFREQQSDAASRKTGTTTKVLASKPNTAYGAKPTSARFSRGGGASTNHSSTMMGQT